MKTITITAPAAWATYLCYGEEGRWGLEPAEEQTCKALVAAYGTPADVQEVGFCWRPDYGEPGNCCEYTFVVREDGGRQNANCP